MLLLELLNLLQGKEGAAAAADRLLGVAGAPLLEGLCVATLHVQAQVLPVPRHEVAHVAGEWLLSWRNGRTHRKCVQTHSLGLHLHGAENKI